MDVHKTGHCLSFDTTAALVQRQLPEAAAAEARLHISACEDCRVLVAEATRYLFEDDSCVETRAFEGQPEDVDRRGAFWTPVPGNRVGRYVIQQVIGAGGMGVVCAAHDPTLDRKIALKLIRQDLFLPAEQESLDRRLLREARAMAQLAHPNVVGVYDAGMVDDQLFIAMELVEGVTLRQWIGQTTRSCQEIISVFLGAACGLMAAHQRGLVHRDFKPENVLIGRDGRPRVTDFGLARALAEVQATEHAPRVDLMNTTSRLTQSGVSAGTPAYMAPEQFLGGTVDARTDQFSFCVALYEALHGKRPFEGTSAKDIAAAILAGTIRPTTPGGLVPAGVDAAIMRGLSVQAHARFASMELLLAELAAHGIPAGVVATRRSRGKALLALGLALGLGVFGVSWLVNQHTTSDTSPHEATSVLPPPALPTPMKAVAEAAPVQPAAEPATSTSKPAPHRERAIPKHAVSRRSGTGPSKTPRPEADGALKPLDGP